VSEDPQQDDPSKRKPPPALHLVADMVEDQDGNMVSAAEQDQLLGTTFAGRYDIVGIIGAGGMGKVYKARHNLMSRMVAIKVVHPNMLTNRSTLSRFQREAEAISRLNHPNVITVYDFGLAPTAYLAMDYLDGPTLGELLQDETYLDLDRGLPIFMQLCAGLAHAHKNGVVHRDLKPSNIMLVDLDGQQELVKILDFGIAKLLLAESDNPLIAANNLTVQGDILGSPFYLSPEQCQAKAMDVRSDIYSLGCIMFRTLSGHQPIEGKELMECLYNHVYTAPKRFADVCPELNLPPAIELIIQRCLSKQRDERFQSMGELREALLAFAQSRQAPISTTKVEAAGPAIAAGPLVPAEYKLASVSQEFQALSAAESAMQASAMEAGLAASAVERSLAASAAEAERAAFADEERLAASAAEAGRVAGATETARVASVAEAGRAANAAEAGRAAGAAEAGRAASALEAGRAANALEAGLAANAAEADRVAASVEAARAASATKPGCEATEAEISFSKSAADLERLTRATEFDRAAAAAESARIASAHETGLVASAYEAARAASAGEAALAASAFEAERAASAAEDRLAGNAREAALAARALEAGFAASAIEAERAATAAETGRAAVAAEIGRAAVAAEVNRTAAAVDAERAAAAAAQLHSTGSNPLGESDEEQ